MRIVKKIGLIVLILLVVCFVGIRIWISHLQRPILQSDHSALLSACRELIEKRSDLRDDSTSPDTSKKTVILNPRIAPLQDNVPDIIKKMKPAYVTVTTNEVMICFSALPRIYVLAFPKGAREYGTQKLVDGLWLSNDPNRDQRETVTLNK